MQRRNRGRILTTILCSVYETTFGERMRFDVLSSKIVYTNEISTQR